MGGFLLMLFGLFSTLFPYPAWYLSIGWRIKDAEPSEAALFMNRAVGVVAAIVGLIIMVSSCSLGGGSSEAASAFQKRLQFVDEVRDIKMGMSADLPSVLSKEEVAHAVDLMAHAKMKGFTLGSSYSGAGEATIVYKDWTTDELLITTSGGIELIPRTGDKAYLFQSDELESLFHSWLSRSG